MAVSISVRNLGKSFGTNKVFDHISLSYGSGVLGIAGSNGSGKSTFLKILAGLEAPTRGTVQWTVDGESLDQVRDGTRLGYAAPYINLYDELTVRENLQFLAKLRDESLPPDTFRKTLSTLDALHFENQPFGRLSTGQQQRVRLAAALFHRPEVLFLDEPCSNLDEKGTKAVRDIVTKFRERKNTVLLASNNRRELEWCDKVYSVAKTDFIDP